MSPTVLHCRPPDRAETRIEIGVELRNKLGPAIAERVGDRRGFLLIDRAVRQLDPTVEQAGLPTLELEGGEAIKSFSALEQTVIEMSEANLDRSSVLIAVGGGTIGDLGGLAASLYLRGIEHWQVPTTLLSMVDSCVGGKTAINLPTGKNLAGTFWPATSALIDPDYTADQSDAEYKSGLGEVLKVAIGLSRSLFELCEKGAQRLLGRDRRMLTAVVQLAIQAKIDIVEKDPNERGARRLLNLGHTLGHALEAASGFSTPHGIAVARGLHFALERAQRQGCLTVKDGMRCHSLLELYGFMADRLPDWGRLKPFLRRDKKSEQDRLFAVLPDGIGSSRIVQMDVDAFTG